MKLNKTVFVIVFVLAVLLLSGQVQHVLAGGFAQEGTPPTSLTAFFVQLDPKLQEVIVWAVTALVSYLVLQIAALSPALAAYLGAYKTGIVVWFSGLVFQLMQNVLNGVGSEWDAVLGLVMQLIVAVVIVLTTFAGLRRARAPGSAALM